MRFQFSQLLTLGLLGSGYAASFKDSSALRQVLLDSSSTDTVSTSQNPACEDVVHAELYLKWNDTSSSPDIPLYHNDGRVYASSQYNNPTVWTFEKYKDYNSEGYLVYTVHPSGQRQYWTRGYYGAIEVRAQNYDHQVVSIAQGLKSDTPFDKVVLYWDDRCLTVPKDHFDPVSVQQNSACHELIAKIAKPIEWKNLKDLCSKQ